MTVTWKKSRIVAIALAAFTIYVIVSLFFINKDISSREDESKALKGDIEQQQLLNKEMQDIVNNGVVDKDYVIKMAREKLNFVFPDETVYKDMTGN